MSKFKEYYADPEFKKKHNTYMLEKVDCECGFTTARCNMTKHKKGRNHKKRMMEKEEIDDEFFYELNKIVKQFYKDFKQKLKDRKK